MGTNPAELMDRSQATDDRMIFDEDMSSQGCPIRHDDLVPNLAVMGDMGVSHDEILISKNRLPAPFYRASMEGDKLSNDIMVTHLKGGGLSSVSNRLRSFSNGGELIDLI